jgi:hypothetical protein
MVEKVLTDSPSLSNSAWSGSLAGSGGLATMRQLAANA